MQLAQVINMQGEQVVKLPDAFRFDGPNVSIRKAGEAVILEPVKPSTWPAGFFEAIRIDDPAFARPEQGTTPPAPALN
jgi:virulence-associated protein VagC